MWSCLWRQSHSAEAWRELGRAKTISKGVVNYGRGDSLVLQCASLLRTSAHALRFCLAGNS